MGGYAPGPVPKIPIAFDTIGGEEFQKVKIVVGEDGEAEDTTLEAGLKVTNFSTEGLLVIMIREQQLTNLLLNRLTGGDLTTEDLEE